jgi:hypothetical protein
MKAIHHIDQPVGRLAPGHDVSRQDKHGHRNQRGWPDAAHHLLNESAHLAETIEHHYKAEHRSGDQRHHHREAEQQQPDHDQHHCSCHVSLSLPGFSCVVHTSDSVSW